jgi:large subunit ribosomal protein L9
VRKAGYEIERSEVRLPHGPIRQAGEHTVQIHLHTDLTVDLPLVIVGEE